MSGAGGSAPGASPRGPGRSEGVALGAGLAAELDRLLRSHEERAVPAVAAIVVDEAGVCFEGSAGSRGAGAAMATDTVCRIASMTKPLTCTAALQLVERGALDLDRPAAEVCPELAETMVLEGFDGEGQPRLRPPVRPITLRHLLTHTSGYGYEVWNDDLARYVEATGLPPMRSGRRGALAAPLLFDPGTDWAYGIGIDWAGQLVERAAGTTLGAYLDERVTGPLGMADTAFVPSGSMVDRLCWMHTRRPDGSLREHPTAPPEPPEVESGGGGLYSTVADYGRFLRMILGGGALDGTRVLSPESLAALTTNAIGPLRVRVLVSNDRELSNDAEFFPGDPKSWSLGFQVSEVAGGTGRPAGTLMWAGMTNGYFWIDPRNGVAGALLTQLFPFADPATLGLFGELEAAVYRHLRLVT